MGIRWIAAREFCWKCMASQDDSAWNYRNCCPRAERYKTLRDSSAPMLADHLNPQVQLNNEPPPPSLKLFNSISFSALSVGPSLASRGSGLSYRGPGGYMEIADLCKYWSLPWRLDAYRLPGCVDACEWQCYGFSN